MELRFLFLVARHVQYKFIHVITTVHLPVGYYSRSTGCSFGDVV